MSKPPSTTPDKKSMKTANAIRNIRHATGTSPKYFAQIWGFPQAKLAHWEQGTSKPNEKDRDYLNLIATTFNAPLVPE